MMKPFLRATSLVLLMLCFDLAIGQNHHDWQWQNPMPQGRHLSAVHFPSASLGFAVGDDGAIVRTTDGGNSWENIHPDFHIHLRGVHFPTNTVGYAVGDSGAVLKTTNAGNTWVQVYSELTSWLDDVYFVSEDSGFVVGGDTGLVLTTTNGGLAWSRETYLLNFQAMRSIQFVNDTLGYMCGQSTAFKTTDAGVTWDSLPDATGTYWKALSFVDELYGFMASDQNMKRTTDGGLNWDNVNDGLNGTQDLHFINHNIGWKVSDQGVIEHTTDGSDSWTTEFDNNTTQYLRGIWAASPNSVTAVGEDGLMVHTSNSGAQWTRVSGDLIGDIFSIDFGTPQNAVATMNDGKIARTTNAGQVWTLDSTGITANLTSVSFGDANTVYVAALDGSVLKSTDAGHTWQSQNTGSAVGLKKIHAYDAMTVVAMGGSERVTKTTDGGNTWNDIHITGNTYTYENGAFVGTDTIYVIGSNGRISKSVDGGVNWSALSSGVTVYLRGIHAVDKDTVYVSGANGTLLKTTNGGSNWAVVNGGFRVIPVLFTLHFTSAKHGIVASSDGWIYTTDDFGNTWTPDKYFCDDVFYDIDFTDSLHGYMVGRDGKIAGTYSGGLVGTQEPVATGTSEIQILNCFPNPSSGRLTLQFNLMRPCAVDIELFDVQGKSVLKRSLEPLTAGRHESKLDASSVSAGLYILRVSTGTSAVTHRIVLE